MCSNGVRALWWRRNAQGAIMFRPRVLWTAMACSSISCCISSSADADDPAATDEQLRKELEFARSCLIGNKVNFFCILCRKNNPSKCKDIRSHIIPNSVLSAGKDLHCIGPGGQEVGHSKLTYQKYCESCECMLSEKGELHFNPVMHEPLVQEFDEAIDVKDSEIAASIHHCGISIWWRFASLTELAADSSSNGTKLRQLLEVVRVWLHNPDSYMPKGLHVLFTALNSEELSILRSKDLDKAATGLYGSLNREDGRILKVVMGPLHCLYLYFDQKFKLPSSVRIAKGVDRPRVGMEDLECDMISIRKIMLNIEQRASNREPPPSAGIVEVSYLDLIPKGLATVFDKSVEFHYHWLVKVRTIGKVKLLLYKPKKEKKGDERKYYALAIIPSGPEEQVRVWLQSKSDYDHKKFEVHKDVRLLGLTTVAVQALKDIVDHLQL